MPKTLTLADVERVLRKTAPEWWDALTEEERLQLVEQYNAVQDEDALLARQLDGPPRKSRG